MNLNRKIYKTELSGEELSLEVSKLAHQANAAVIGRQGGTAVLATVVMGKVDRDLDYFPLTVDYEERFYAAGKIIGSRFIRREGRPSEEAILSARLIDRTIRPLFDHRLRRDVQVVVTVLAYDEKNDPDPVALMAVSTALSISDVPWNGPVAGVRMEERNPEGELRYLAFFSGPETKVNMIEFEGKEISEKEAVGLFQKALTEIKRLTDFQKKIAREIGKSKAQVTLIEPEPELKKKIQNEMKPALAQAIKNKTLNELKSAIIEKLKTEGEPAEKLKLADRVFDEEINNYVHREIIESHNRPDGRKLDEVRELYSEVGLFGRTHGSGLFIRGDTQILAVTTLGTPAAEQLVETMEITGKKRFMLHYNFPGFATGEMSKSRGGPGRREIGHGALAAKAIFHVLPSKEEFPYTIRVVAETLSSNGSSSMASVCAASLSLMDAGVPIKKPVAGIAMGLMLGEGGKYKILTDIQGPEDHHGDMDLKIAGTEDGITAIQMDVKVEGITEEIFSDALEQAKKARLHILSTMAKTLSKPRPQISPYAPTILTFNIKPDKIGLLIGPGGRTINSIINFFDGKISIDIEDNGKIFVAGIDPELVKKATEMAKAVVHEYAVGEIVEGSVVKILDFGAIVDLGGGNDGMIHISELKEGFVKRVEDVVKVGDRVRAKVIRVEDGKIGLSLKDVR
jgi:polyribonucleotide nucleotidyltransferase